jgi:hypothetical protein
MSTFEKLLQEAEKRTNERNRLSDEMLRARQEKRSEAEKAATYDAYIGYNSQAYSPAEGGKVVCEATLCSRFSRGGFRDFYQFRFYFLPDGADSRKQFSRAKAIKALS